MASPPRKNPFPIAVPETLDLNKQSLILEHRSGEPSTGRTKIYVNATFPPVLRHNPAFPRTAYELFNNGLRFNPEGNCLGRREWDNDLGDWGKVFVWDSYIQTAEKRDILASGVRHLVGDAEDVMAGIWCGDRPEWQQIQLGLSAQSIPLVSLYDTLGPNAVHFCLQHSEISIAFTTGNPKGAIILQGALAGAAVAHLHGLNIDSASRVISYLPLSHLFERMLEDVAFCTGAAIGYSCGDNLRLLEDIQILHPTVFAGAPRVLNRIYHSLKAATLDAPGLKGALFRKAFADKTHNLRADGVLTHPVWDRLAFKKVRDVLGSRINCIISGSAPIAPDVLNFFKVAFSTFVFEGYGGTENNGSACRTLGEDPDPDGTTGPPVCGVEVILVDVPEMGYLSTDKPYPRELKDPVKTAEAFDKDGWILTGDIGSVDSKGRFRIIDRIKNLVKLTLASKVLGRVIAPDLLRLAQVANDRKVVAAVAALLETFAQDAKMTGYERLKDNFHISLEPFTAENGIITPTFKIKRDVAAEVYKADLALDDSHYQDELSEVGEDDELTPPKASLSSLPLEIQARVCQFVAAQDAAYKDHWVTGDPYGADIVQAMVLPLHGHSLPALAQTNKRFNELAAKHLFFELKSRRTTSHFFRLRIMPRHLAHFRRLTFDSGDDKTSLDAALSLLPILPHLQSLHLTQAAATTLLGNISSLDGPSSEPIGSDVIDGTGDYELSCDAFRSSVRRITSLTLTNFSSTHAKTMLACFPALTTLHLVEGALNSPTSTLPESLSHLPKLSHLTLETRHLAFSPEWLDYPFQSPLKSLSLIGLLLSPSSTPFIESFAPTLLSLSIDLARGPAGAGTQPSLPSPYFSTPFPLLSSLSLSRMSMEMAHAVLTSLASPTPSPLASLSLELSGPETITPATLISALKPFVAASSTLHSIRAVRYRRKSKITSVANKLARLCDSRPGVHLSADSRHDPFLYRMGPDDVEEVDRAHRVERRCEAMLETIEFGKRWVERMRTMRDFGGTEVGFKALSGLKALQLLEVD
ncbi:hypothetical protein RQP46_007369 [Phenoliferia psychrophenolica]